MSPPPAQVPPASARSPVPLPESVVSSQSSSLVCGFLAAQCAHLHLSQ